MDHNGERCVVLEAGDRKWLRSVFKDAVRFDHPLADYTTFKIGGPADVLVEPADTEQLKALVQWSHQRKIAFWVMGGGTNLLVTDRGVRGITIRLNRLTAPLTWDRVTSGNIRLTAAAGIPTRRLCALALKQAWQGLNFAVGIPGLLGGAICMNAGTAVGEMASVIEALDLITPEGQEVRVAKNVLTFGYRQMTFPPEHGRTPIVVRAHLRLSEGDGATLRAQARRTMMDRRRTQPLGCACAGSFFKNPSREMPAGRLIDEAGLKGASVGDARVSERHANFIINGGRATASDVLALKALIAQTVWERFQMRLQPEVRIVGQGEENQGA